MRTFTRILAATFLLLVSTFDGAQTYTPATIRFEGANGQDSAQLLQVAGWKMGAPLTKQEIEVGLQKLADTGSFTGLSYTVNSTALVIKLEGAESQELPVRFTNFVWWSPDDLMHQIETRVPLFHGKLSLTGSVTDQVEAALTDIAHEKGISITVSAGKDTNPFDRNQHAVALSIEHPAIVVGDLRMADVSPAFGPTTTDLKHGLAGQEFDLLLTAGTIQHDGADIYRNAGYLDAVVDPPIFAPPRPVANGYAIDASTEVHSGDIYHVGALTIAAAAPISENDLRHAAELKPGDPASPMGILITGQKFARMYGSLGYLDADPHVATTIDKNTHTASYAISMTPGEIYHLASVDASAAPTELQKALANDPHLARGVVADAKVQQNIHAAVQKLNMGRLIAMSLQPDRATHMLTIVLRPINSPPR
jgi:outer membrane protein assembly factor BamA